MTLFRCHEEEQHSKITELTIFDNSIPTLKSYILCHYTNRIVCRPSAVSPFQLDNYPFLSIDIPSFIVPPHKPSVRPSAISSFPPLLPDNILPSKAHRVCAQTSIHQSVFLSTNHPHNNRKLINGLSIRAGLTNRNSPVSPRSARTLNGHFLLFQYYSVGGQRATFEAVVTVLKGMWSIM